MAVAQDRLQDRFFETRATQLAIVHLTRRRDILVTEEPRIGGVVLDLLVALLQDGQETDRVLAVEVKAVTSQAAAERAGRKSWLQRPALSSLDLPVCLFVFSMEDDQGYWQWLRRPDNDCPHPRCLHSVQSPTISPLTDQAVGEILAAVGHWYDRQNA